MIRPVLTILLICQSLVVLAVFFILLRRGKLSTRAMVWSFFALLLIEGGFTAWFSSDLFHSWITDTKCTLCQVRLPGYSDFWAQETYKTWGQYFGINALFGVVFGIAFWIFSRRTGGEIIDRDDVFLLTLGGVITGWPNILLFLGFLFLLSVIVYVLKRIFRKRIVNPRVVITPLIPAAIIATIFLGDTVARFLHMYDLGFVALRFWQ